jgi:hypothetical protein
MEQMSVSSVITLFPTTKTQQSIFVGKLIDNVLNGEINPLESEIQMKNIEDVVKAYRSNEEIKEAVLKEAEKYGQKTFETSGATVQIKEVGVKYNFEDCGHLEYNSICDAINQLTAKKKEIEARMKAHSEKWIETDIQTGETYEVYPVSKSSTTQAVITIGK